MTILDAVKPAEAPAPRREPVRYGRIAAGIAVKTAQLLFGLVIWHLAVKLSNVDPRIFPAPLDVLWSLWGQLRSGFIFSAIWLTLQETIIGFIIGSALGILLAVVVAEFKLLRTLLQPYIVAIQAVPKVAVAPLFLIWFGFGIESKVALVISIMFFPVLVNTVAGLDSVAEDQLELMRAYRATRLQTLLRLKVFVALPYVFASFEVCLVLALTAAVVAEMLGSGTTIGLGTLIRIYESRLDAAGIFAVLIVLSILGVALHGLVIITQNHFLAWQRSTG
jgi:NitT/TauT family transport system permease protein